MNPAIPIPKAHQKYDYVVPRSFKLHEELNYAEKPQDYVKAQGNKGVSPHAQFISIGSAYTESYPMSFSPYETILQDWNVTMFYGPQQTVYAERSYNIKVRCGPNYPQQPPQIWFQNKINIPGVDPTTGAVSSQVFRWTRDSSIMDAICQIRQHMATVQRGLKQPGPNEVYPLPPNFPRS